MCGIMGIDDVKDGVGLNCILIIDLIVNLWTVAKLDSVQYRSQLP
jgi:hypothetical protein